MKQSPRKIKMLKKRGSFITVLTVVLLLFIPIIYSWTEITGNAGDGSSPTVGIISRPNTANGVCEDINPNNWTDANSNCYLTQGYGIMYYPSDNFCGTDFNDDLRHQICEPECHDHATGEPSDYSHCDWGIDHDNEASGRSLSLFMSLLNASGGVVSGSGLIPQDMGSQPRSPGGQISLQATAQCVDVDNRLRPECYLDGLYDVCLTVANSECLCVMDTKICMHYYYVNPDEDVDDYDRSPTLPNYASNPDAATQCSSIVNGNIGNNPLVWIQEGPYDGYDYDYIGTFYSNNAYHSSILVSDLTEIQDSYGPQHCCGDDAPNRDGIYSDAGRLSRTFENDINFNLGGRYLCAQNTDMSWEWVDNRRNIGQVYTIQHGLYDALSTGSTWLVCDSKGDDIMPGGYRQSDGAVGFPRGQLDNPQVEIKSSFWANMPSTGKNIIENLNNININFIDEIRSYMCLENYNYEGFFECAPTINDGRNLNAEEGFGRTMQVGNVVPIVENFEGFTLWGADTSDATGSNNLYIGINNYIVSEGSNSFEMSFDYYTDNNDTLSTFSSTIAITNWSRYYTDNKLFLEFDTYYKKNLDLSLQILNYGNFTFENDLDIIDYSVDGSEINKWHHIIIPMHILYDNTIKRPLDNITALIFRVDGVWPNIQDKLYTTYVDGFSISAEKHYCIDFAYEGRQNYLWERDLDREPDSDSETELYTIFRTLTACENIEYTDYTGSSCCGDDTHEYYNEPFHQQDINITILEANGVTIGGCWNSKIVKNGTKVQPVYYLMNNVKNVTQSCRNEDCRYPMPHSYYLNSYYNGNQTIVNNLRIIEEGVLYEPYDINFLNQGRTTDIMNKRIQVDEINWQIVNLDGQFYGCDAYEEFAHRNTTNRHGEPNPDDYLIPDELNYAKTDPNFVGTLLGNELEERCSIVSNYFCSYEGWSDDTYCKDTSNNGAPTSCISMPSSNRNTNKNSPNIIANGGFERLDSWDQFPAGWHLDDKLSFEVNPTYGHSGTSSIIGNGTGKAELLSDFIPVRSQQYYTLSGWIVNMYDTLGINISYRRYDQSKQFLSTGGSNNIFRSGNDVDWTRISTTFSSLGASYVRVGFNIPEDNGYALLDDMQLEIGRNITDFYDSASSYGCCPQQYCWDGSQCIENEIDEAAILPINMDKDEFGYRCMDGNWVQKFKKYRWDKSDTGYCPQPYQCLVDSRGNASYNNLPFRYVTVDKGEHYSQNPQCINNGQWIGDYFCDRGNWTTRTKLVALKLMEYVSENTIEKYTLFCDDYKNSMNYFDYDVNGIPLVPNYVGFDRVDGNPECRDFIGNLIPCTNNYCVLKYWETSPGEREERVLVGTSLNQALFDVSNPFSDALPLYESCENAASFQYLQMAPDSKSYGNFRECSSGKIFFNNHTNSIVYSRFDYTLEVSIQDQIINTIRNPLETIIQFILKIIRRTESGSSSFTYDFITETDDFARLYKHEDNVTKYKMVYGIVESVGDESYTSVSYEGFAADICNYIRLRGIRRPGSSSTLNAIGEGLVDCQPIINKTAGTIRYVVISRSATSYGVWQDLTSKLRIDTDVTRDPVYDENINLSLSILSPTDLEFFPPGDLRIDFSGASTFENISSLYWDFDTRGDVLNGEGWSETTNYQYKNIVGLNKSYNVTLIGIDKFGNFGYTRPISVRVSESDNYHPEVFSSVPGSQAEDININSPIRITFNTIVIPDDRMINVTRVSGMIRAYGIASFTNNSGYSTLTWYPSRPLDVGEGYMIDLYQQFIRNTANTHMSLDYKTNFTTSVMDEELPHVIAVSPPNHMTMQSAGDITCHYEFSEPVNNPMIVGTWFDNNRRLMTFNNVNCGIPTTFYDRYHNSFDYAGHSTSLPDTTPPSYSTSTPLGGNPGERFSQLIQIEFSEPVRFTYPGARLYSVDPFFNGSWILYPTDVNGKFVSFSPSTTLKPGLYNFEIKQASIRDYAIPANYLDDDVLLTKIQFDGGGPPELLRVDGDAHEIAPSSDLRLEFNKNIVTSTFRYTITCSGGTTTESTSSATGQTYASFDRIINIHNQSGGVDVDWAQGISCSVVIDFVDDNNSTYIPPNIGLPSDVTFNVSDITGPTMTPTPSANSIINQDTWSGDVVLTFDEPMNPSTFDSVDATLYNNAGIIGLTWTASGGDTIFTATIPGLQPGTWTITNLNNVEDTSGNNFAEYSQFRFTYIENDLANIPLNSFTINPNSVSDSSPSTSISWGLDAGEWQNVSIYSNESGSLLESFDPENSVPISESPLTYNVDFTDPNIEYGTFTYNMTPWYVCDHCIPTVSSDSIQVGTPTSTYNNRVIVYGNTLQADLTIQAPSVPTTTLSSFTVTNIAPTQNSVAYAPNPVGDEFIKIAWVADANPLISCEDPAIDGFVDRLPAHSSPYIHTITTSTVYNYIACICNANGCGAGIIDDYVPPSTTSTTVSTTSSTSTSSTAATTTTTGLTYPAQVGYVTGLNRPGSVFADGNYAYVASSSFNGIYIIDVSDPTNPSLTSSFSSADTQGANLVYVSGNYAYVTADKLTIIDITNKASPTQAGTISNALLAGASGIFVSGIYAYVTSTTSNTISIIDVSNVANPTSVGTLTDASLANSRYLYVDGNYAYSAQLNLDGITIVDISNPANPTLTGSLFNTDMDGAHSVWVNGNYAYVASMISNSLTIVDVTNKANPSEIGTVTSSELGEAQGVVVIGNNAYVAAPTNDYFVVIDVSNPANPTQTDTVTSAELSYARRIYVSGNYAYVGARDSNTLSIIQLS